MKTLLILRDRPAKPMSYVIDHYALYWQKSGYRVLEHVGPNHLPEADMLLFHMDLSVIPPEYQALAQAYPKVLNGKILDTSRRRFSRLLLSPSSPYTGPVIVKTNANYGGLPEFTADPERMQTELAALRQQQSIEWAKIPFINPLKYPIYPNLQAVPEGVWANPRLIVQPFIQNRENGLFYLRFYSFFGRKEWSGRIGSRVPIVKFGNSVVEEALPVPEQVRQWRKDLQIDFGRLDYLVAGSEYVLIDVNKTEGGGELNQEYQEVFQHLASGLDSVFAPLQHSLS